eukprot:m.213856 g.213856  ORF g.213856 m.213856 type:complete len:331 (-) comp33160_c1_seq4:909-1901(-)
MSMGYVHRSLSILWVLLLNGSHAYDHFGAVNETTTIVFMKAYKVGGSTVAGIVRHIGAHHDINGFDVDLDTELLCDKYQRGYVVAHHLRYSVAAKRLQRCRDVGKPLFVLAWVREPLERCLSEFYHFLVTRKHENPSSANKLLYCQSAQIDHYKSFFSETGQGQPSVVDAFALYNFVGVTDRFDESMVVLADIMGLSFKDILYLTAKNSSNSKPTGAGDVRNHIKMHRHPPLSEEPSEVRDIATSNEFRKSNAWSLEFYKLAHKSLDNHINIMGKELFALKLAKYRVVLVAAQQKCVSRDSDVPKCYYNDHGCGYECLDKVFKRRFNGFQ